MYVRGVHSSTLHCRLFNATLSGCIVLWAGMSWSGLITCRKPMYVGESTNHPPVGSSSVHNTILLGQPPSIKGSSHSYVATGRTIHIGIIYVGTRQPRPTSLSGFPVILCRYLHMCEYTHVEYVCYHHRHIVRAWCTEYERTHIRCPPKVVAFEFRCLALFYIGRTFTLTIAVDTRKSVENAIRPPLLMIGRKTTSTNTLANMQKQLASQN
jgi:hypothetical protein